jgi:hypothetical protein
MPRVEDQTPEPPATQRTRPAAKPATGVESGAPATEPPAHPAPDATPAPRPFKGIRLPALGVDLTIGGKKKRK